MLINSVTEGSTQVSVGISSENEEQATQNSQTISNNEASLPLSVLSSNVDVYYNDKLIQKSTEETAAVSSSNMGVIIGAAVGAVVVIAVAIFACYKYKTRKNAALKIGDSNQIQEDPSEMNGGIAVMARNHVIAEEGTTNNNINNLKMMYA